MFVPTVGERITFRVFMFGLITHNVALGYDSKFYISRIMLNQIYDFGRYQACNVDVLEMGFKESLQRLEIGVMSQEGLS